MSEWETVSKSSDGWEEASKKNDGWEDASDWETVSTTPWYDGVGTAALEGVKGSVLAGGKQLLAGTVGLPSLAVDAAVRKISGDEDYLNPVSQYIVNTMDAEDAAKEAAAKAKAQSKAAYASGVVGEVAGMLPEMLLGGGIKGGVSGLTEVAGEALPNIVRQFKSGITTMSPVIGRQGTEGYITSKEKGNNLIENINAGLGQAGSMALQSVAPGGAAGGMAMRAGTGALTNAAMGIAGREVSNIISPENMNQELYNPESVGTDAAIGALLNVITGGKASAIDLSGVAGRKPTLVAPAFRGDGGISPGEFKEMTAVHTGIADKLIAMNKQVDALEKHMGTTGDFSKDNVDLLKYLEEEIQRKTGDLAEIEDVMQGNKHASEIEKQLSLDIRKQELIEQIKAKREYVPATSEEAPLEGSKTPPVEIALTKIGEALEGRGDPIEDRIIDTQKKLDSFPDVPKNSAIREALQQELKAFQDIAQGKQPDLSWFEANKEKVDTIQDHPEIINNVLDVRQELETRIQASKEKVKKIQESMKNRPESGPDAEAAIGAKNREINRLLQEIDKNQQQLRALPGDTTPKAPEIKNKELPTPDEIGGLISKAKTIKEVFQLLREKEVGTKGQRQLMSILERITHAMDAKFSIGETFTDKDGNVANGYYDPNTHEVVLGKDGDIRTILHETIHAATVHLLDAKESVSAKRMVALFESYKSAYGHIPNKAGKEYYGFTDVREFVSEVFVNPSFQKFLSDISVGPDKPKESMYAKFKTIIKEALGLSNIQRTALDNAIDAASDVIETAGRKDATFWQKLSQQSTEKAPEFNTEKIPTVKDIMTGIGKNLFGMNAIGNFFYDKPIVQRYMRVIREASETGDKIHNALWHGNVDTKSMGVLATLNKVTTEISAKYIVMTTPPESMANLHDVFKLGFEEGLEYVGTKDNPVGNLEKNGGNLTPAEVRAYKVLAKLYAGMEAATLKEQKALGKKHLLPHRPGWYPAKRMGEYSVEISYNGNLSRKETFKTRLAAENFRRKLGELKVMTVSDVLIAGKEERTTNAEFAEIAGDVLARKYETAGDALKKTIDQLVYNMQTKGGKLGYHHQFRTNVAGYRGSELFISRKELGISFKEGIQGEVSNFGQNIKGLILKTKLDPYLTDMNNKETDPTSYEIVKQMYESTLGRNTNHLEQPEQKIAYAIDRTVDAVMRNVLGKEFQAKEGGAATRVMNTAMNVFYSTSMYAKPVFSVIGQLLTTPMIIPEIAKSGDYIRPFYSFAKAGVMLSTGNKKLWDHIKSISQEYNTVSSQFLESMNLEKHTNTQGMTDKVIDSTRDYVLFGKVGEATDSMSRLYSYASAYVYFTDIGLPTKEASYRARQLTAHAMNDYGSGVTAPMFDKLGALGKGMQPLASFGLNALGNTATYMKMAIHGNMAPLISMGLISTAIGGVLSLPFIQEYERWRMVLSKFTNITMPSILEIFSGDDTFLDRLNVDDHEVKKALLLGLPALTGLDLSVSVRSNETQLSVLAAIASGQEDAITLFPLVSATAGKVAAIPEVISAVNRTNTVGEGRKAVDALIRGPVGYGIKEALDLNTTRTFGKKSSMTPTGLEANANIKRTGTEIAGGLIGAPSVKEKLSIMRNFELVQKDKMTQNKMSKALNMFVESGDPKYIQQVLALGQTKEGLESAIKTGIYKKNVGQFIRYFRSTNGHIDPKKLVAILKYGKESE